ncbi:NAD-dependent epimerase/dehydratase family protein [Arthrobacter sp. Br18]|uniref:NAD-dependent epimerase/dehydratase family protein n=1 Tax=Arthrobacter sp. Br18 TaxID=1312954 RepID=UPI0004B1B922|nr:NAD-dependent epimerase/dehydratase family protein [Arthrobacter sp. Br18]
MGIVDGLHVVIGAGGGTGTAVVRELQRCGRRVRGVNRSGRADLPDGVEVVAGDAADPERMRQVCRGSVVVYNAVNPPLVRWRQDFPAVIDGILAGAGAGAAGARMVFVDDTWMYGKVDGPMTEDLPDRPVSSKGVLRAWLAERVLAAHARGEVATVIGRAPELYGPAVESLLGRTLFVAAVRGKAGLWAGSMTEPLTPMFIDDFAYGLVELGERADALGRAWHLPTPPPTTAGEFIHQVSAGVVGISVSAASAPGRSALPGCSPPSPVKVPRCCISSSSRTSSIPRDTATPSGPDRSPPTRRASGQRSTGTVPGNPPGV